VIRIVEQAAGDAGTDAADAGDAGTDAADAGDAGDAAACDAGYALEDGVCVERTTLSAGGIHTCGVKADGTVACWETIGTANPRHPQAPSVPLARGTTTHAP
jgi:hypothetical protein